MRKFVILLITSLLIVVLSCGESPTSEPQEELTEAGEIFTSLIIESDKILTIENLVSIGWKKNKEFDNSEFPETQGIWYGFFQKRDIEIWIYDSHTDAVEFGVAYAEEAIQKRPGQTDYMIPRVNRYHAYLIFGNLLLLCEDQLSDCQKLIEKLN